MMVVKYDYQLCNSARVLMPYPYEKKKDIMEHDTS